MISQIGDQRRLGDGPKEVAGVFRLPAKAVARFCVSESGIQSDLTLLSASRSIRNLLDHLLFAQTASVVPDHAHFFPTEISVLDSHAKKRVLIFLVVGSKVSWWSRTSSVPSAHTFANSASFFLMVAIRLDSRCIRSSLLIGYENSLF